jgi:hypothetical protein
MYEWKIWSHPTVSGCGRRSAFWGGGEKAKEKILNYDESEWMLHEFVHEIKPCNP